MLEKFLRIIGIGQKFIIHYDVTNFFGNENEPIDEMKQTTSVMYSYPMKANNFNSAREKFISEWDEKLGVVEPRPTLTIRKIIRGSLEETPSLRFW